MRIVRGFFSYLSMQSLLRTSIFPCYIDLMSSLQENKCFGTFFHSVLRLSLFNSSPILGTTLLYIRYTACLVPRSRTGHQRTHFWRAAKKWAQTADFGAVDPASLRPVAELMIPLWGEIYLNGSN